MNFKASNHQIFGGSIASRVLLRALMLVSAISIMPLGQILSWSDPLLFNPVDSVECGAPSVFRGTNLINNGFLRQIWGAFECKEEVNVTVDVVRELIGMKIIDYSDKALCIGEGSTSAVYALEELGFSNVCGFQSRPFFSLKQRKVIYELAHTDNSFDFVFSGCLNKISVPAILVLEIERVLKPGGIGAMLVDAGMNPNSLIKYATPISSSLKTSTVVHVGFVHKFTLVVFRKKTYTAAYFEQFPLPADCRSMVKNRPWLKYLEPLTENKQIEFEKTIAYLPKFVEVATKKRLVYVDIGTGRNLNSSAPSWLVPSYPMNHTAFNVYLVHHNTSVLLSCVSFLLSCVKKLGVTFIYQLVGVGTISTPNLGVDGLSPYAESIGWFDFVLWFKETVQHADFVVLKMKAGEVELRFLIDLFKSGTICFVDELFLTCSDDGGGKGVPKGECMDLFQSLRSTGVYVHQWWGD